MKKLVKKSTLLFLLLILVCSLFIVAACEKTVAVTRVELNAESLELLKDETFDLVATVKPENATNKNVTWSSDDEDVATVSNSGKVTAVGKGFAIITVTTADGDFTATCGVNVSLKEELLATVEQEEDADWIAKDVECNGVLEFYALRQRNDEDAIELTGKIVIKDAVAVDDLRLIALSQGWPNWEDYIFFSPVLYDFETEFYYQEGNLIITSAMAIIEGELKDENGQTIVDGNGDPVLGEIEKDVIFQPKDGTGEQEGSIIIESNIGKYVLDAAAILDTQIVEREVDYGELLLTIETDNSTSEAPITVKFYDSGKVVFSENMKTTDLGGLPVDPFITEYEYSDGTLTISNGQSKAYFGAIAFDITVEFTIIDGEEGAINVSFNGDSGDGNKHPIGTFTITAEQLDLLS